MKITFITVSATAINQLIQEDKHIASNYGEILDLKIYYASAVMSEQITSNMEEDIKNSDLVFIDLMGSNSTVIKSVYKVLEQCKGNIVPYGNTAREFLRLGDFTAESKNTNNESRNVNSSMKEKMQAMKSSMAKMPTKKVKDMKNYGEIISYFKAATQENIRNMLFLIMREYGGTKSIPEPVAPKIFKGANICNPESKEIYDTFEEYEENHPFKDNKPNIVILYYGHTYPIDTSKCVGLIKNRIEEFANVLPIGISGSFSEIQNKLQKFIIDNNKFKADLIINFMSFRLGAGPMGGDADKGIEFLKSLGVPYFHPFFMTRRTAKQWRESIQGCSISEVMISIMLPELDGAIETYPIASMSEPKYHNKFNVITEELELIEERVERLISRVKSQLALRYKNNKDKKVAIICYNYPPGESNIFGGAFLDTFASVENILKGLKEESYEVEALTKKELMELFTAGRLVNSGRYCDDWEGIIRYSDKNYKEALSKDIDYKEMLYQWGEVPGKIMTNDNHEFLIPGTISHNVFIGLQPSRGIHEEPDKAYHDKELLPHHQYQGFYKWIREEFKADAIIHVGTHGTLEFLKGKESGISGDCYGDRLIGNVPHMYLYYCGNPSESAVAKRRSNANLISYQSPVFVQGELYGDYSRLKTLIDNYRQALVLAPQSCEEILAEILNISKSLNMSSELEAIESELYNISKSLVPMGLHIFGNGFTDKEAREYVRGVLNYSRGEVMSLRQIICKEKGYDIEELIETGDYETIKQIDKEVDEIFNCYITEGKIHIESYKNNQELINTLKYGKEIYKLAQENYELRGLLNALSAQYNPSKLAGDIYRHPEILPTGYNLHQFDARLIPTNVAYERGRKVSENTIKAYKEESGIFPKSTAVILWGIETSRTQGETLCQILSYLGVKPSNKSTSWEPKYEVIPIEKLGRPRIDVTINICGFFRDMFPNLIENLSEILEQLYDLDESPEENYFKANSKKLYEKLINQGYEEKEAKELAISRIFGPNEGEYGTGITGIIETKNWEDEKQIGTVFLDKLQHVYNRNMRGKKIQGLYEENLKAVELISQIRSSHEYQITDLDHYYEFFGGLSKSVEIIKGNKAKLYITDTTEERILTESIEKSIERGIRTRVLNPKWINGMLEHKYHGVQQIAKRFENLLGLAATTNSVNQWIYNDLHGSYIEDDTLSKKMQENNPYAYMDILQQMMEYYERGYWKATEEQIEKIKERYLDLEDYIEGEL